MYLRYRFYYLLTVVILILASGYAVAPMFTVGRILLLLLVIAVVVDVVLLWRRKGIKAFRQMSQRFSNGDENPVSIRVESAYAFAVRLEVIDEIPFVFQRRDVCFKASLQPMGETTIKYRLRPTQRGVYGFGHVRVFASTVLGLVQRRFTCCEAQDVKVYPSYLMLRQYELLAMSNNLRYATMWLAMISAPSTGAPLPAALSRPPLKVRRDGWFSVLLRVSWSISIRRNARSRCSISLTKAV